MLIDLLESSKAIGLCPMGMQLNILLFLLGFFFCCCFLFGLVLYLFSNFTTVLGLVKFYPLSVAESSSCINDYATCPFQFPDPAKVYDPAEDYILSLHQHFSIHPTACVSKVSKGAKIRNRYNQVPHLTQDTNGKVTNSQLDTTNES